ncbi:MAG: single-strand selective monofunctional uracil DNA glycosylase [Planctomycetota bacterium]|jgi:single-strand selective monofunctional uracil DNA glycosylase
MQPLRIASALTRAVNKLEFAEPVTHVYNPLSYAKKPHSKYIERFARTGIEALFLGMNPGPFGMAQTGVPFGEVNMVRDWLGIEEPVGKPKVEHPKRPILGFDCTRSEVSGRRLWGWAQERFPSPEAFFERFFIWNYCPLVFLEESGRNHTPDKLPAAERDPLFEACDIALVRLVKELKPQRVIGVGKFALKRARTVLADCDCEFGTILHPSPASPMANRGWAPQAEKQLIEMGFTF